MLPQPKQEMFENLLAVELAKKSLWNGKRSSEDFEKTAAGSPLPLNPSSIWLEDEAQRIGDLNLPNSLWRTMRRAPLFFLDIPFEERLDYIVEEYGECDVQKLIQSTQRISQRLGGLDTKNTIAFLSAGEIKEAFRILLRYYDKYYLKGLHNRDSLPALLSKIDCKTVTSNNALKLTKPQPV